MISFHWSYLIIAIGLLAVPVSIYRMSGSDDRYGIGAMFGAGIGVAILLVCSWVWMAVKLWRGCS